MHLFHSHDFYVPWKCLQHGVDAGLVVQLQVLEILDCATHHVHLLVIDHSWCLDCTRVVLPRIVILQIAVV